MDGDDQAGGALPIDGGIDPPPMVLERGELPALLGALRGRGYQVVGPRIREQAIVYGEIEAVEDLPIGYTDEQDGGRYRLRRRGDDALFGYAVGPHSWKQFLHPPLVRLWQATRQDGDVRVTPEPDEPPRLALLGVRACELAAIQIQDRVLLGGAYVDPRYRARRERVCIVAVNCGHAGGTCFCVSMGTGPQVNAGFDLCLTEVLEDQRHYFVVEAGSPLGQDVLAELPRRPARDDELRAAGRVVAATAEHMGRQLDRTGIEDLLMGNLDHPRWNEVATRCLACGNCTQVCPTCFCTAVEDTTDLTGAHAERWRRWDSCYTTDFSHLAGGSIRVSTRSRYRQWMTHKLATWQTQFGTLGCVGCGRCITWCPVGIDLTEETAAIRGDAGTAHADAPEGEA